MVPASIWPGQMNSFYGNDKFFWAREKGRPDYAARQEKAPQTVVLYCCPGASRLQVDTSAGSNLAGKGGSYAAALQGAVGA
jgi:hypothetical protein